MQVVEEILVNADLDPAATGPGGLVLQYQQNSLSVQPLIGRRGRHTCGQVGLGQHEWGCEGSGKMVQGGQVLLGEFLTRFCFQFTGSLANAVQEFSVLLLELVVVGLQRIGMVVGPVPEARNVFQLARLCDTGTGRFAEFLELVDVALLEVNRAVDQVAEDGV